MQVVVDNLLITYSQLGVGKKIILCLHGWADSSATFKELSNKLKSDYSLVLVDLPGFGGSQAPAYAWSIPEYSNFLKNFLTKLKIAPYAVVGHSNGGAIAIQSIANNLIDAHKLILLAASGVRTGDSTKKQFYKIMAKPAKFALSPLPQSVQTKIKRKAYGHLGSDLYAAEHMKETFKNIVNYDVQSEARSINLPTLLVYGDKDNSTPPSQGRLLAGLIRNSTFEVVEGADHFLHQQQPDLVAEKIMEFLK